MISSLTLAIALVSVFTTSILWLTRDQSWRGLRFIADTGRWGGPQTAGRFGQVHCSVFGSPIGPEASGVRMLDKILEDFEHVYALIAESGRDDLTAVLAESGAKEDSIKKFQKSVAEDPTALSVYLKPTSISQKKMRRSGWTIWFDVALPPVDQIRFVDIVFEPQGIILRSYDRSAISYL